MGDTCAPGKASDNSWVNSDSVTGQFLRLLYHCPVPLSDHAIEVVISVSGQRTELVAIDLSEVDGLDNEISQPLSTICVLTHLVADGVHPLRLAIHQLRDGSDAGALR